MFEFHLPDMTCGHCASRVTQALKAAEPACRVQVDLPAKTVRVLDADDRDALAGALAAAGYPPTGVPATAGRP